MKNITVTMEEPDAEWIRIEAAKRNSSVSRLLGEQVREMRQRQDAYERGLQDWLGKTRGWTSDGSRYPSRVDTGERS